MSMEQDNGFYKLDELTQCKTDKDIEDFFDSIGISKEIKKRLILINYFLGSTQSFSSGGIDGFSIEEEYKYAKITVLLLNEKIRG